MEAGEWDEGLSPEAREELEVRVWEHDLTAGQQRALSKEAEGGQAGYERPAKL